MMKKISFLNFETRMRSGIGYNGNVTSVKNEPLYSDFRNRFAVLQTFFGDHFPSDAREKREDCQKREPSCYVEWFLRRSRGLYDIGRIDRRSVEFFRGCHNSRIRRNDESGKEEEKNRSGDLPHPNVFSFGNAPSEGGDDTRNGDESRERELGVRGVRFAQT
jgi:hypothetical protein